MPKHINVLIVEDSEDDAKLIVRELTKAGYEVRSERVETSAAMLQALRTKVWDVVISDYRMPGFSGIDALKLARANGNEVPFILVSGTIGEEVAVDAIKAGATDYLLKDRLARLVPAVERALREAEERRKRRQAEEELRQSEERYRTLFECSLDAVYTHDLEGHFIDVNPTTLGLLGYSKDELARITIAELIEPGDLPTMRVIFEELKKSGRQNVPRVLRLKRKDGSCVDVEVMETLLSTTGSGGLVMGVARDLTERKKAESRLRELEEQFRQAQKLETIGRLAGGIAHDFNNMLSAIIGYSEMILRSLREGDPLRRDIEQIRKAAERSAELTRQLLAFSRRQVFELKVVNLNSIIKNMEDMLRRLIGEDIALQTILPEGLWNVKVDPGQIEQVIMNLVVNARDAMPNGGTLTIDTTNVVLDEEYASRHVGVQPGEYVMLAVSDTGCGMTEEVKSHLFEPFFTTKEKGKGTGLGLSTVYGIVKQSGGNIWVYSEPGRGTTFKIYLPRSLEKPDVVKTRKAFDKLDTGTETILVVEDEPMLRGLARRILELAGYRVLEASNAQEALAVFEKNAQAVDLVITDVVMPGMSGKELAKRLEQMAPGLKVLFTSGYTENAIVNHGVLEPGVDFIQKPFTPSALARKVREVLGPWGP